MSLLFTRLHANACVYVYTPYTYDKWIHMNTYTSNCVVYACVGSRVGVLTCEDHTKRCLCTRWHPWYSLIAYAYEYIFAKSMCTDVASSSQKQRRYNRCAPSWRSIQTRHTIKAGRGAEARVVDQDAVHIRVVVGRVERLLQVSLVDLHRTVTVSI